MTDDDVMVPEMGISPHHLKLVLQGMNDVMNHPRGTAYSYRIKNKNIAMGGKTGTTQVRRISLEERRKGILKSHQRPWQHREHALFVGYAPVTNPRYAVSVLVEHGGGGASTASPIGRDIMQYTMSRDPLLSQNIAFDVLKNSFKNKTAQKKRTSNKKGRS
jgi:penicillin-binding protein 2